MISIININNREWNNYVKKLDNYDVFYLKEYVEAFMNESKDNGIPILFVYENGDEYGINVVFKRDIQDVSIFNNCLEKSKYFDLTSPYGYGGFIGNIRNYDVLNREYGDICKENGIICEFVRFHLFSNYKDNYMGEIETRTHNVIRDLSLPMEEMWMDFRQKVRKNVNRANKNGLKIVVDKDGCKLEDFLNIYYGTMKRTNAENQFFFSKNFFQKINSMDNNKVYFHVIYENKVISTELVLYGSETAYSYLGGTNSEYFDLRPNDFLKYEIIKWCKENNLKSFVLGGGYGTDDGIFQYKSNFAPNGIVDFYIGRRILDKEKYEYLSSIRRNDEKPVNEKFFPIYRS